VDEFFSALSLQYKKRMWSCLSRSKSKREKINFFVFFFFCFFFNLCQIEFLNEVTYPTTD
jgi:hypothetical protein